MTSDRLRQAEVREQADMNMVAADPDTVETAAEGTFAFDTVLKDLYVNWDGATQWERLAVSSFACISVTDNVNPITLAVGVPSQILDFDTNGPSFRATPDHTNDHITIVLTGDYLVVVSATVNSIAGAASRFELTVKKNNGATTIVGLHVDRNIAGGGGNSGSVGVSGIVTFTAGDTVEVFIENETNNQNYIIENITLTVAHQ